MGLIGKAVETVVEDIALPVIVVGVGAVLLAPILIPVGKPIAKAAIKGGLAAYEKSKGVFAEVGEAFEDLVAEAKAELAESHASSELRSAAIPTEATPISD
ncbi:DUF5132 domain-containing protein [Ancylothrix sp. C2]|uniref:DUF5132 domain-containing protein n=1 Tax=Ancylothrix sp. D3o TaxID=2953691 RepID=UPI0021BB3A0A|nr:DUF5132 domain-containing protein [Ancylothrix sp. D3o]MCT7951940.1 DUF5132 domain-containing protein [Ancylothrix sp. D3o]